MSCFVFFLTSLLLASWSTLGSADTCSKVSSCSCTYSDGHIDLSPLAGNPGPKWQDQYDQFYNNRFSYNPCTGFTEGTCNNVAVCQMNNAMQYFECGTQESANFLIDDSTKLLAVEYSKTDSAGLTRYSRVVLNCITAGPDVLEIQGEGATGHYGFKLSSVHCCKQSGGMTITVSISVGSVLVIVFFAVLIFYVIGGVLFQKFARHASGKEILPNYTFWSGFPSLVKDGTLFVFKCGRAKTGYNSI
ncbi:uncharacterized protein LOC131954568 [Physella acuta]|uniref:uncharacterized protein LOC131954568 n=1 Tax=Physella acuta TaxID=109671 RepID=UPI0027DC3515|nr:uncharacterized protein LOC131954568 [Physella acuta]